MAGLWVGDVDPVEKDEHLVEGAAVEADVGLNPVGAALTDVNTGYVIQQGVQAEGWRRRNIRGFERTDSESGRCPG